MFAESKASSSCTGGCSVALLGLCARFLAGGICGVGFVLGGLRLSFSSSCFLLQGSIRSQGEIALGLRLLSRGVEGCFRRSEH